MSAYLWIVPFLGLTALIVFLFVALQRWTAAKQQQMSAEEFRLCFRRTTWESRRKRAQLLR